MTDSESGLAEQAVQEVAPEDKICFYCKQCKACVEVDQINKKYVYKCKTCGSEDVTFGTSRAIEEYFGKRNKSA